MRAWNEPSNVEQFDRNGAFAIDARAIDWFATIRQVMSYAGTLNLQVSDRALRVDGSEAVPEFSLRNWTDGMLLTGSCLRNNQPCAPFRPCSSSGLTNFRRSVCQSCNTSVSVSEDRIVFYSRIEGRALSRAWLSNKSNQWIARHS